MEGPNDIESNDSGLLRSRIDQQSELICILKKRADEYISKYDDKEEECRKAKAHYEKITKLREEERKKVATLENSYFDLQKSHDNLLAANKQTQHQLEELKRECVLLKESNCDFLKDIENKDSDIKSLEEDIIVKNEEIKKLQGRNSENAFLFESRRESIEASMMDAKKSLHDEKDRLQDEMNKLQEEMAKLQEEVESKDVKVSEVEYELELSFKEKKELEAELTEMTNRYCTEKKRCLEFEEQCNKKLEKGVSSKNQVLQRQIVELEEKQQTMVQNFNAYKDHTQDLLLQEKSLNNQLRKLKSPDHMRRESTLSRN